MSRQPRDPYTRKDLSDLAKDRGEYPQMIPEIPKSWLIALFLISMVILRCFGIDSVVTGSLMGISGYLLGVKLEQTRNINDEA